MANFFDKIGQSISNAGDSMSLNKEIKENQELVQNLYKMIGTKYYDAHKDDENPEYEEIALIKKALANLSLANEKLRILKGLTICSGCGAEVSLSEAFCSKCGAKIIPPVIQEEPTQDAMDAANADGKKFCTGCGSQIPADSGFCPVCGAKQA